MMHIVVKKVVSLITLASFLWWNIAFAGPEGSQVVAGNAEISQAGNTTTINQTSQNAVINWNGFNTTAAETVQFNQPNSSSIALNRIMSGMPTQFDGALLANGHVWIINPAGVVFGASSRVDVAGLVATTLNIQNNHFMNGNYQFDSVPGFENAKIINNGLISAKNSGLVVLVAPGVENNGVIVANLGKVVLASGSSFILDLYGDQLINFGTSAPVDSGYVSNSGLIQATGGKVLLTTHSASQLLDNVISMSGVIEATTATTGEHGEIILQGNHVGKVKVTGTLNASDGGFIDTSGADLDINSATIMAGVGGEWLIDPSNVTINSTSTTNENQTGVNPIVFDPTTTSNTSTILNSTINTALSAGTSVTINTTNTGTAGGSAGNIVIGAAISHVQASGSVPTLTLNAGTTGTITFTGGVGSIISSGVIGLNVVFNALANIGSTITIGGAITTNGGNFTAKNNTNSIAVNAAVNAGAGNISLTTNGAINQNASGVMTAGLLTISSATGALLNSATSTVAKFNATNTTSAAISLTNSGPLEITGVTQTGTNLTITNTTGAITQSGIISVAGTSSFSAGANPINLSTSNNAFTGVVTLTNSGASNDVNIKNNIALSMAASTIGRNFTVITNNAAISQTGLFTVGGTSSFTAGASTITLLNNNLLTGAVTLSNSGANLVTINNNKNLILAASTVGGNLTVNANTFSITQSGALVVPGASNFSTASNSIDLSNASNNFTGAVSIAVSGATNNISLRNNANLILGAITATNNFTVVANGNITQTGVVDVNNAASFTVGAHSIDLSTQLNKISGDITFSNSGAFDVSLTNINATSLATSSVGRDLTVTLSANRNLSQTGPLTVPGKSSFSTLDGTIILQNAGNNFTGAVSLSDGGTIRDIRITNNIDLVLGTVTASQDFFAVANGAISQFGSTIITSRDANISAGAHAITLTNNNFFSRNVTLTNSGANNASITNNTNLSLASGSIIGQNLAVIANGNITQTGGLTVGGTSSFAAGAHSITLASSSNLFSGAVAVTNSGAFDVSLSNTLPLVFNASTIGRNLTVLTDNDAISQLGALSVGGTSSFNAPVADIDLLTNGGSNLFTGAVTLTNSGATHDISINNNTNLILGATTVGRNLTVTANGNVSQIGVMDVVGTSSFIVGAHNINLNTQLNIFRGAITFGAVDVNISNNGSGLKFATSNITGNLTAIATGDRPITQTGPLTVSGTSSFSALNNVITLTDTGNSFSGAVTLSNAGTNQAVNLTNSISTILNTSNVSGILTILSGNNLTLNGALTSGSGNDIILSAVNLINNVGAGALVTGGRFLIYLGNPSGSTFNNLSSGNQAVWNQTITSLPPGSAPSGNRYIFSLSPSVTLTTTSASKNEGDDLSGSVGTFYTTSPFVNAATYGNVFTQDTGSNALTNVPPDSAGAPASAPAGSYAVISNATATTGYALTVNNTGVITVNSVMPIVPPVTSSTGFLPLFAIVPNILIPAINPPVLYSAHKYLVPKVIVVAVIALPGVEMSIVVVDPFVTLPKPILSDNLIPGWL